MPDTPLTDPRTLNKNPQKFAELLQSNALGHVLWTPSQVSQSGAIGDCGYITGGRFVKLFNVFDTNDLGFPQVSLQARDVHVMRKGNLDDVLSSSQVQSISISTNFQVGPVDIPPSMQLQLRSGIRTSQEDLAFLAYYGRQRTITEFDKLRLLENYLVAHGPSIVEIFSQEYPVTIDHLVIIHGTTSSASWLGGISSSRAFHVGGEISVGGVGGSLELSSAASAGWLFTYGDCNFRDDAPDYCIVAKMVKCKRRRLRDRVQTAVSSVSRTLFRTSAVPGSNAPSVPAMINAADDAAPPGQDATSGVTTCGRSLEDLDSEPLAAPQYDLLDQVLGFILKSQTTVDCVVGSWGVIETCLQIYGDFPENWESLNILRPMIEHDVVQGEVVGRLMSIEHRGIDTSVVSGSQGKEIDTSSALPEETGSDLPMDVVDEDTATSAPDDSVQPDHPSLAGPSDSDMRREIHRLQQQIDLLTTERRVLYQQLQTSGAPAHPEYLKPQFHESWQRRTDARTKLMGASSPQAKSVCAWHDSRRERRAYPQGMAPSGVLNCGCSEEEALFEESLARNGVGAYRPSSDRVRMNPELRKPLLALLQRRYGYKDGDFEINPRTGTWADGEGHDKWEERLRTGQLGDADTTPSRPSTALPPCQSEQ